MTRGVNLRLGQGGAAIACGGTAEEKTGNVKLRANKGVKGVFRVIWRRIGEIGQVGLMRWGAEKLEYRISNIEF